MAIQATTAGVRLDTADAARFSAPAPSAYRLERLPAARGTRFAVAKFLRERDLNLKIGGYPGNLG